MKSFLKTQLKKIDEVVRLFDEPDDQLFDDLRTIVRQTEQKAAQEGLGSVHRICQIREGGIAPDVARQIITESIGECQSPKSVQSQRFDLKAIEDVFERCLEISSDPVAAATLSVAAIKTELHLVTFTPEQAGVITRSSPETVIKWIRSGQLKAANLSKSGRPKFLVFASDLLAFLESRHALPPMPRQRKLKKLSKGYDKFSASE